MMDGNRLLTAEEVVLVAVGGFVGANSRFLVALLWSGLGGTLVVNALGSFLLGIVVYEARYTGFLSERTQLVVATGFLSSFTTYSTFVLQSAQAPPLLLVGNVIGSYTLGFAGVFLGREVAGLVKQWSTPGVSGSDVN